MDRDRYLDCLASDLARLRAVVPLNQGAPVPTCPGWTVADLTRHVGEVYLHKTAAIREGVEPPWPPPGLADEEPLALLDRAYAALRAELTDRRPEDPAGSWYEPDQTVGFWVRRMPLETVVHRIDAEIGTGQDVAPVPADLAVDGIDELLRIFVEYGVREWPGFFADALDGSPGRTVVLRTDGAAWRVRTAPAVFAVTDEPVSPGDSGDHADATVSGPPAALLRWVWNREPVDGPSGVTVDGSADAVAELRRCIVIGTQ